jgi:hypothetical protein
LSIVVSPWQQTRRRPVPVFYFQPASHYGGWQLRLTFSQPQGDRPVNAVDELGVRKQNHDMIRPPALETLAVEKINIFG